MAKKLFPPKDREAVMEQVRSLLAEHFDVGLFIVSWEDNATTFHMESKFGNDYAVRELTRRAEELLWPAEYEEDDFDWEDDEDDDEEEFA
jgi:hypothetical protein